MLRDGYQCVKRWCESIESGGSRESFTTRVRVAGRGDGVGSRAVRTPRTEQERRGEERESDHNTVRTAVVERSHAITVVTDRPAGPRDSE